MKTVTSSIKTRINKDSVINFRVTNPQKQELELKASEMSLSVSSYLSHVLSDYDNLKKRSQELNKKSIESMTQKEIIESALLEAKKDSEMVANPAFNEFYESVNGRVVSGKLIKSKSDLLGLMASSYNLTVVDDKEELAIPLTIRPAADISDDRKSTWFIAGIAVLVCAILAIIYFTRKTSSQR